MRPKEKDQPKWKETLCKNAKEGTMAMLVLQMKIWLLEETINPAEEHLLLEELEEVKIRARIRSHTHRLSL